MSTCSSCGVDNPEQARFCMACAAPLTETDAPERFRKTVTILFTDVVGSTALGERLDAETLSDVMTEYFGSMGPIVERHGGTLAKFMGDAILAVFGIPQANEDDALRAVRSALEMRTELAALNPRLERRWGVTIATRTGVNTGPVAGAGLVPDRSFIGGDTANTAARLQTAAGPDEILLGDRTYRLVHDEVEAELLPPLDAKGKAASLTVYRLLAAATGEPAAGRPQVPMVGRDGQLAALEQAFRDAVDSRSCRLATVVGEPGVGKSRLVRELIRRIGREATVLRGRCLPYGEGITYWPLGEIVRAAAGIGDDDDDAVAKIELLAGDRTVAELVAGLIGAAAASASPAESRWAVRTLLERVAARRPVVAVIDDLQWAEEQLLALVDDITGRTEDAPVLVLGIARPELLDVRPDWPGVLTVESLSGDESDRLIAGLLGHAHVDAKTRAYVVRATGGNPLFCEHLIAMLVDDGVLVRENGGWVVRRDLADLAVPPSVQAVLTARLDRLPSDERAVVGRAATVGQAFSRDAVAELLPPAVVGRLDGVLDALAAKQLIAASGSEGDSFGFRHLLIRDVAYDGVTKESRARFHESLADWRERQAGESDEIVGYHLEQAHRYHAELRPLDEHGRALAERGATLLETAGRRAFDRGDMPAAVKLLRRAIALLAEGDPRRPELLALLGSALVTSARFDEAEEAIAEAARSAERAGDENGRWQARLARLRLRDQVDPQLDVGELERDGRAAAEFFAAAGNDRAAAESWRIAAWGLRTLGRTDEALVLSGKALAHAIRAGGPAAPRIRASLLDMHVDGRTPSSEALAIGEQVLALVGGHPLAEASVTSRIAYLHAMLGHERVAEDLLASARQAFRQLGVGMSYGNVGRLYVLAALRGWAAVEPEIREYHDSLVAIGDTNYLSTVAGYLAQSLYELGRDEEAERASEVGEKTSSAGDVTSQTLWRSARAKVFARTGRGEEALALARGAVELAAATDRPDLQGLTELDLAEVLRLTGRVGDARSSAESALRCFEVKEFAPLAARTRELLDALAPESDRDVEREPA